MGLGYAPGSRQDRLQQRLGCITEKHDELYATDPVRFVEDAYFQCVVGLRERTRRVLNLVFGEGHEHITQLFSKVDGRSLSDIRSEIAHGALSLLDRSHEKLVRSRLGDMAKIAMAFLTRVAFRLASGEDIPTWSGHHVVGMSFHDPRSILVVSTDRVLPSKDWRIRPEWCE